MGIRFDALSKTARLAVADHVRREFERLTSLQPETYVSRNAKADPKRWQDGLRELIARDPKRVESIVLAAERNDVLNSAGFTLIELSIVLVIIGLIVGGVLVGQDLIRAAGERATITQIEKFNTAANTFYSKYGYLPGDIKNPEAGNFGFLSRGQYPGEGDGNGLLEGVDADGPTNNGGARYGAGELNMFWVDLSTANLIDASFHTASPSTPAPANVTLTSTPSIGAYFPAAKIGRGNYIYVWSGNINIHSSGVNYYSISAVTAFGSGVNFSSLASTPSLTVKEAYDIDKKIDDGYPQSGNVTATYQYYASSSGGLTWAAGGGLYGASTSAGPTTVATPGSANTCYDNSNASGAVQQYSVEISNGANVNCALSFKMQAGD